MPLTGSVEVNDYSHVWTHMAAKVAHECALSQIKEHIGEETFSLSSWGTEGLGVERHA